MKKDFVFSALINLRGLYSDKPTKCFYDTVCESWWDKSGNFEVRQLGLDNSHGIVQFSSRDVREVELFILGAKSVMNQLQEFSK